MCVVVGMGDVCVVVVGIGGHMCVLWWWIWGTYVCVYTTQFLVCQDMMTAHLPQTVAFVSLPPPLALRAPLGPSQGSEKRELATLHQKYQEKCLPTCRVSGFV